MRHGILILTLTVLFGATETAFADTYQVSACSYATPAVNNSWQPFNNNTTYLETSATCGASDITGGSAFTSGLAASDVLQLSTNVPAGALAGWQESAPVGDWISAITMDRDLYEQGEGWEPQIVEADGNPLPGETCPFNASNGGCEASGVATHTGLDTKSVAIELLCDPEPAQLTACGNGFSEHDARVELNGATVTITDEQSPQITSTSGSLFTGGAVRSVLSGTIQGSDSSGVHYARLYLDGAQVANQANPCDFTQPAPCPTASNNQFTLDTSTLPNGQHQIQAAVVDAAGNLTLGPVVQVTVENSSPAAPNSLQVNGKSAGAWINQPATITWTNPGQPDGDPIGQVDWIACPGSVSSPVSGCDAQQQQSSPLSSLTFSPALTPAFGAKPQGVYTVFVWLKDAAGNSTQANAASISFGYQTSPPPTPTSITASGQGPYTIALGASADIAPLTATNWIACNAAGACTPTETTPGLVFVFDPRHTPQFQHDPYGRYTIRAWLQDAAGNTSPANSATLTILYRTPGKPSPQLHILSVTRTGHTLHVRGSAARTLSEHVTIIAHYTLNKHTHMVQKTVLVSRGKWAAILSLPSGARTTRVTVIHHTSARWLAQTATRYVHHPSTTRR
jgi:hypothetical protein